MVTFPYFELFLLVFTSTFLSLLTEQLHYLMTSYMIDEDFNSHFIYLLSHHLYKFCLYLLFSLLCSSKFCSLKSQVVYYNYILFFEQLFFTNCFISPHSFFLKLWLSLSVPFNNSVKYLTQFSTQKLFPTSFLQRIIMNLNPALTWLAAL